MLSKARLSHRTLRKINLDSADLFGADLRKSDLSGSSLHKAHLREAKLAGVNLNGCNLRGAHFREADLTGAQIVAADLSFATLVMAQLKRANLSGSKVYGVSAWDVDLDDTTTQTGLIISKKGQPLVTVDNLEVAQFISLLLNNRKIREVIDAVTGKAVLILGRFTEQRKMVLEAIRNELRKRNYVPILFDFERPRSKDVTGTIETLARMARFIIADVTDPSSVPHELATLVPTLRTTPVLPLRLAGAKGYSMIKDLQAYSWVLETYEYKNARALISALPTVIAPANRMANRFRKELKQ